MTMILIQSAKIVLRLVNLFFMPLSLKDKVTIISRQSDEPTLDIRLLDECLGESGIKTVVLTKTLKRSFAGLLAYCFQMIGQMYHIATSKVVVLDGYCILVSILPKKKGRRVIQMWHALGAVKKFGWQNLDSPDGHDRRVSEAMNMHGNYDYVLAPGTVTGTYFAEAFHVSRDKLVYCGLPRIDFIRADDIDTRNKMEAGYPAVKEKETVLYVPTFRKNAELSLEKLISGFDFTRFNLVIKKHFLDKGDYSWAEKAGAVVDTRYSSLEWLRICDKVITDYSAIAFEAAILKKDLYFYQPDETDYEHNVGLNIDMSTEAVGKYVCKSEEQLFAALDAPYEKEDVAAFGRKYIEIKLDHCTGQLRDFIAGLLAE